VLFHGLTNCPQQFDEFAQLLHARGENVYVPRLPFHGHTDRLTPALGAITGTDIEAAATVAARFGSGLGSHVGVLGLSLGATMALWLAQTGSVGNAVGVAPFLMVPFAPRRAGMLLMRILSALPNRFLWWDPRLKERMLPPYAYPGFWTHCLAQSTFAGEAIFAAAARSAPAAPHCTLVLNAQDPAVSNGAIRELAARWRHWTPAYGLEVWNDLGKVHDVIDPSTYPAARTRVYPRLAALLEV
jgi:alpha-beta hydrolase superfamily lysophospholipase